MHSLVNPVRSTVPLRPPAPLDAFENTKSGNLQATGTSRTARRLKDCLALGIVLSATVIAHAAPPPVLWQTEDGFIAFAGQGRLNLRRADSPETCDPWLGWCSALLVETDERNGDSIGQAGAIIFDKFWRGFNLISDQRVLFYNFCGFGPPSPLAYVIEVGSKDVFDVPCASMESSSPMACGDGALCFISSAGDIPSSSEGGLGLIAYDTDQRETVWNFGRAFGPLVLGADNLVFSLFTLPDDADLHLGAFDPGSGERVWEATLAEATGGSPYLMAGGAGNLYVSYGDVLYAFEGSSGEEIWNTPRKGALRAISADETIFVYDYTEPARLIAIDSKDGSTLWENDMQISVGPILAADGTMYVYSLRPSNRLLVVDSNNGHILSERPAKGLHGLSMLGTLFISTEAGLTALATDSPMADTPWPMSDRDTRRTRRFRTGSPTFFSQPESVRVETGQPFAYGVLTEGSFPKTYQWEYNGRDLDGRTDSWLSFPNPDPAASGEYRVRVTNAEGTVRSKPALVSIQTRGTPLVRVDGEWVAHETDAIGQAAIRISSTFENPSMFYTLDGSPPNFTSLEYFDEFSLHQTTTVRSIAYSADFSRSEEADPVLVTIVQTFGLDRQTVGEGAITADPPGDEYPGGTEVRLTALPAEGWRFVNWQGDASGDSPITTVVITGNTVAVAVFDPLGQYRIETMTRGGGAIEGDENGTYWEGAELEFLAVADAEWEFMRWTGGTNTTSPRLTITVSTDLTVEAVFGGQLGEITVQGAGTAKAHPQTGPYPYGSAVRLVGLAEEGHFFARWGNDLRGGVSPVEFRMIDPGANISALFAELSTGQVALNVDLDGQGMVNVHPPRNYFQLAEQVVLQAMPDGANMLLGWSGDVTGELNPLTLSMAGSKNVIANFGVQVAFVTSLIGWTDDGFQLALTGPDNTHCEVQYTSDFATWTDLIVVVLRLEPVIVIDPVQNGDEIRFYRAVVTP